MAHPICAYLDKHGLRIQQLADISGVGRSDISRVVHGRRPRFSVAAALKLARATGMSVDELLSVPKSPRKKGGAQ